MGVQLSGILPKQEIDVADLKGRIVAIDAFNSIYQFLAIIRQPDGTPLMDSQGRTTSHLSGLFYRTAKLVEMGLKPIYVFDGEPPAFKHATIAARGSLKEEAKKRWEEALERGDVAAARSAAQATSRITDGMLEESKELLEAMGVPVVQAPSEGEAQAAFMCRKGAAWAAASQDYDALLFGTPRLVRNLTLTGRRKLPRRQTYVEIRPEMITLDRMLAELQITHEQLILLGILVGTDYNPGGIRGLGPKKSLKLVREKKTAAAVFAGIPWPFDVGIDEIMDFFKNPPVREDYKLSWRQPDKDKIMSVMVDEHEFSAERIEKSIKSLEPNRSEDGKLDRWFVKDK